MVLAGTALANGVGMGDGPLLGLDLTGIHVLIVDDDADARDVLAAVLRYTGALVSSVNSVPAALAAVHRGVPDVIVSDIAMPGESGYDLVRAIRRDAGLRPIPVIAVTGYGRLLSRNRALAVGFKAYLDKPVDVLKLCRTIRTVLFPFGANSYRKRATGRRRGDGE